MESTVQSSFSLPACYARAWKTFAKWWIPLCLVAGVLIVFELGPKQIAKAQSSGMTQSLIQLFRAVTAENFDQTEETILELYDDTMAYTETMARFTLYAMPVVAVLTIVLLCASMMAVKDQRIHYSPWRILWISFLNTLLAFVKVFLLIFLFPLGVYIYIKLYFASLAMVEEHRGLANAVKRSWALSSGKFWPLLGIAAINSSLLVAMAPTLIGLIPATGFANTARATAFELLRNDNVIPE